MECAICRKTHISKRNGEYVCDVCGARYTEEEANELLIARPSSQKSQCKQSKTGLLYDYLEKANRANSAGSYYESEVYCNKALALDEDCYEAWRLKAEVISLQCGIDDRTNESISCYEKALDTVSDENRDELLAEAFRNVNAAVRKVSFVVGEKYSKSGSFEDGRATLLLPLYVAERCARFKEAMCTDLLDDVMRESVADNMTASAICAWTAITLPAYVNDVHRNKAGMDVFVMMGDLDIKIVERSFGLFSDHADKDILRHEFIISLQEKLITAHSMQKDGGQWVRAYSLSEDDKAERRKAIEASQIAIRDIDPSRAKSSPARSADTSSQPKKRLSVMDRTVTWRLLVAMFCMARFMALSTSAHGNQSLVQFSWLAVGIIFTVWWYLSD